MNEQDLKEQFEKIKYDNIKDLPKKEAIQTIYEFFKFIKENDVDDTSSSFLTAISISTTQGKEISMKDMPDEMLMMLSNMLYSNMMKKGGDVIIEIDRSKVDELRNKMENNEDLTDEERLIATTAYDILKKNDELIGQDAEDMNESSVVQDVFIAEILKGVLVTNDKFKHSELPLEDIINSLILLCTMAISSNFESYTSLQHCMDDFKSNNKEEVLNRGHQISHDILNFIKDGLDIKKYSKDFSMPEIQTALMLGILGAAKALAPTILQDISREFNIKLIDFAYSSIYNASPGLFDKLFDENLEVAKEIDKMNHSGKCHDEKECSECDMKEECNAVNELINSNPEKEIKKDTSSKKEETRREKDDRMKNLLKEDD